MFARKTPVSPRKAAPGAPSKHVVTHPPEKAQRAASQASAPANTQAPSLVNDVLASPGHPLDAASRLHAERLFGHDFTHVRVHTDERAAESARAVHASAYTVGRHVVFGAGESPMHRASGRGLLLHELAHTIQQQHAVFDRAPLRVSQAHDPDERQADAAVQAVLSGAPMPALGSSNAHVARQPKAKKSATEDEAPVDTMAGAQVSQIIVWLGQNRVGFQTSHGWVFGSVDTDLTEGSYELKPDLRNRKWVITKPAVKTGLRFFVDLEGAIPWTLGYPATLPLTVTSSSAKTEQGDIPDTFGLGYNTIYKKAGSASKAAVLALALLETPRLFVDIEAYKKLDASVRKSILDLEPHAAGTGCAGWFDVMRANDPDFKPKLTPAQIAAGEAAYYGSMRDARLEKKEEAAKAEAPTLDRNKVESQLATNKYGLVAAAQTPNHGIKAEALQPIWVQYWADKVAIADKTLSAITATELRDHVDLSDTDTFRKAKQVNEFGLSLLSDSVGALEICRTADALGKSLTLDEITQQVISHQKFMDAMQIFAAAVAIKAMEGPRPTPRGPRPDPVKAGPVKAPRIDPEISAEVDKAFEGVEGNASGKGGQVRSETGVRVPVDKSGKPANVMTVGGGRQEATDLGIPPDRQLVSVTKTDIDPSVKPDLVLDGTKAIPKEQQGKSTALLINNPYGYTPNIGELKAALTPQGKIIVQGNWKANKYFRGLATSELPPGMTRTIERDVPPLGTGFKYTDPSRSGAPIPDSRITFEFSGK
ncbi:DUF4157 domain-containing protein [Dyella choica]|nr:DUF4157 domain-containing protein [Dyella choica]